MFSIMNSLIQAIVGRGLYEQYTRTADEVHARAGLACNQMYTHNPQMQGPPHDSLLDGSPKTGTERDVPNTPPADLSASKSASVSSSSMSQQSPITIWERSNPSKPLKPTLIPEYNVVHNHCLRITEDVEHDDSSIMQCYEYRPLRIGPAIGFQAPASRRRIHAPPRKVTALESLPSLGPEVAAEIARRVKVREQADAFAVIRKAQEKESERQRRANRAARMKVPSHLANAPILYGAEDVKVAPLLRPQPTSLTQPQHNKLPVQPDQHWGRAGPRIRNADKEVHVRWAPELASQRSGDSTALEHGSHRGTRTNPWSESKRF